MKVSVIVPAYNIAELLPRCLESILAQSHADLEIIAVNDGSTDGTSGILREYARRDNRIRVIEKPNGGVGSARNAALDIATGEYTLFVDGDDRIEPDYVAALAKKAQSDNIVFARHIIRNGERQRLAELPQGLEGLAVTEAVIALRRAQLFGWVSNKIFSTAIIRDNRLRFDTSLALHEDELFTAEYCRFAKAVAVADDAPGAHYEYIIRKGSAVASLSASLRALTMYRTLCDKMCDALPDEENRALSARIFLQQCAAVLRRCGDRVAMEQFYYAYRHYKESNPEKFVRDRRDKKVLRRSRVIFACRQWGFATMMLNRLLHL